MEKQIEELKTQIEAVETIAIFGHEHIDGDCIGCMLSLGDILEKKGKKVTYYTPLAPDTSFQWIEGIEKIQTQLDYSRKSQLHIFVDFSTPDRISGLSKGKEEYFEQIPTIVIDHHIGEYENALISIKDILAPSCAEWLFELYQQLGWTHHINTNNATLLYMGIVMDTGNFFFDGNNPRTLNNAATLVELGANKNQVVYNMFRARSFDTMKFAQRILSRLTTFKETILRTYTTQEDKEELQLNKNDEEYVQFMSQQIAGYPLTIIFKFYPGVVRMSLRSRDPEVNNGIQPLYANEVANLFGGGGHQYAAGAKLDAKKNNHHQVMIKALEAIYNYYCEKESS